MLSAILYLGNVTYTKKATGRDEGLDVGPPEVLATLSDLLKVTLMCVCDFVLQSLFCFLVRCVRLPLLNC